MLILIVVDIDRECGLMLGSRAAKFFFLISISCFAGPLPAVGDSRSAEILWDRLFNNSPINFYCMEHRLKQNNISVDQAIKQGLSPRATDLKSIATNCNAISNNLKGAMSSNGSRVFFKTKPCSQKLVNEKPVEVNCESRIVPASAPEIKNAINNISKIIDALDANKSLTVIWVPTKKSLDFIDQKNRDLEQLAAQKQQAERAAKQLAQQHFAAFKEFADRALDERALSILAFAKPDHGGRVIDKTTKKLDGSSSFVFSSSFVGALSSGVSAQVCIVPELLFGTQIGEGKNISWEDFDRALENWVSTSIERITDGKSGPVKVSISNCVQDWDRPISTFNTAFLIVDKSWKDASLQTNMLPFSPKNLRQISPEAPSPFEHYVELATSPKGEIARQAEQFATRRLDSLDQENTSRTKIASANNMSLVGSIILKMPGNRQAYRVCTRSNSSLEGANFIIDQYNSLGLSTLTHNATMFLKNNYSDRTFNDFKRSFYDLKEFKSLESFYETMETNGCVIYVDFAKQIQTLITAFAKNKPLHRGKPILLSIGKPVETEALRKAFAEKKGLQSFSQVIFGVNLNSYVSGRITFSDLAKLERFQIVDQDSLTNTLNQMMKSGYSNTKTIRNLIQWLADKQDAGSTSGAIKLKVAREQEEARQREVAAEERKKKRIKKAEIYPFYAVLKCTAFGNSMPLAACMVDGSRKTSVRLRTRNSDLDVAYLDLKSIGRMNKNQTELKIDLPKSFFITGQNASDRLKMELGVYDQISEKLIRRSEAGKLFGVVSAVNK